MKVLTIGVYGFDADSFFRTLREAGVGTLCDIRLRRGVRGSAYAFANSTQLQQRLQECGIRYVHAAELAPSAEIRAAQYVEDKAEGVGQRTRQQLADSFVQAYEQLRLAGFDPDAFVREYGGAGPICLLCVEREPEACHRSIVARRLEQAGYSVEHLLPPQA